MIRIAQAASSENFGKYGQPPNQRRTGVTAKKPEGNLDGELNILPFSTNGWQRVFRAVDPGVGNKIAWIMERAVANGSHVGYGQNSFASDGGKWPRTGLFDALAKQATPDPLAIKDLCNCDCSSSAGASVYHAGVKDKRLRDMWTGNMREILLSTGQFVEITDKELLQSAKGARRGDILLKTGHTAIIIDTDPTQDTTPCRIVDCKACNLRQGPGTEYAVVKELHVGDRVDLISRASNGWGQVIASKDIGFVSGLYYKPLPTMHAIEDVWLRATPGKKGQEIIVIPKGATVYATGRTDRVLLTTWYECIYAGRQGWASGKLIKE